MSNRASLSSKPLRLHRRISLLGASLCSLLALMACTPKERPITGAGGSGGAGSGGATVGPGGATPCETSDPACECSGGQVVARDLDGDLQGSNLCAAAPGADCDDGDDMFVKDECGGCNKAPAGKVGDVCGVCGTLQCQADMALLCAPPTPAPRQCTGTTVQVCTGETWMDETACAAPLPACNNGACVECIPGEFKCGAYKNTPVIIKCLGNSVWEPSWSISCTSVQSCHASTGTCAGLFHPRDLDFDVPRLLREAPGLPALPGRSTQDVLDLATGFAFG